MKGIVLAGGYGSRLHPLTLGVSKQMLPVFDKPMVYYPLSTLMLAGIGEILVISTPHGLPAFRRILRDGSQWGLEISYAEQSKPVGLADALIVGRDFIGSEKVCLILGDNLFFGHGLPEVLRDAATLTNGAVIFAYHVRNPRRYGVVEFDEQGRALSLEEKPETPRSQYAVPGIYFYDENVGDIVSELEPSNRGELEITDVNRKYMDRRELRVMLIGRGVAWLDAGTHEALMQAGSFVQAVQNRQGMMISCPEEIAYRMGFIGQEQLIYLISQMPGNEYKEYLARILQEEPSRLPAGG